MLFHFLSHNELLYDICLFQLPLLLFQEKKTACSLSQYIFIGLDMESTILRLEIEFLNQVTCIVAS
jgi:hypothetical protein